MEYRTAPKKKVKTRPYSILIQKSKSSNAFDEQKVKNIAIEYPRGLRSGKLSFSRQIDMYPWTFGANEHLGKMSTKKNEHQGKWVFAANEHFEPINGHLGNDEHWGRWA